MSGTGGRRPAVGMALASALTLASSALTIDAAVIMLREEIEVLPVVSSHGSGRVIGVVSLLDLIQKAIAPLSRDSTMANANLVT